jgi:DNA-binding SARP family transcriptional activator/tetratricopeptide (TPR) repeat protein
MTRGADVELRLFGEVELRAAGRLLDVGTPRQQAVLAALIVDAGRPVAIETVIDRVWDDTPPVEARNVLYSHLSRIRQVLRHAVALTGEAAVRIERRHAGYVLEIDPDLVDLHRFWRLVDLGRKPQDTDADRVSALTEALGLWRGTPLAALSGEWVTQVRDSWHRQRLDAVVQWAQAELRLGHPSVVATTLPAVIAEYPLVEPLEGLLMRALHATGRDAEAIDRYTTVRQRLADHLGTDPGSELRALHQAILRGKLSPPPPPPPPLPDEAAAAGRTLTSPAQLPPDVYGFTGRDDELHHLDGLLTAAGTRPAAVVTSGGPVARAAKTGGTVVVSAIAGTAGIGKTALAVHWAHRVADRFGDGQLYVNLRGFDPSRSPVPPAEAVRGFLDAFAVPPQRIPASLEAQVGLYRSLLAGRRVLVVLDNARDAEQVRPLLPGAPGCLAVVTSRNQLAGLVAAAGAHPLTLDLLSAAEARDLLARRLGPDRVAAEPHAVDEIITLCARLPLALALAAARAATHPGFGLAVLAGELREARGGLDEFAGADLTTDVRAVFSWSCQQLSPEAARLFRLLGLHPGPDVAAPAAASLAGLPVGKVRPLLAELARVHLVTERAPGRYTFHDLLRAYATELAHSHHTGDDLRAATQRMLDHYLHTAHTADSLLNPHRDDPTTLPPVPAGVGPEHLADRERALAWFVTEHPVLLAAIRQVAGFDAHVWQLAWTLTRFLGYQGYWHDSVDALSAALDAARRLADPLGQAFAHRLLGCDYVQLGRYEDARTHLQDALDLYRGAGDNIGQAHAHRHYSWMLERQERHREALAHARQSLDLFRAGGHRAGQARALNAIGWFHALLGGHEEALNYCQQALDLQKELGDRFGQAETWDSLGYAHHHLGRHARAITCYQTAIELYREFDHRYSEADTLASLGDAQHAAGDLESARTAWRRALDVLDQLGHPDAAEVRAKLSTPNDRDERPGPGLAPPRPLDWPCPGVHRIAGNPTRTDRSRGPDEKRRSGS